MQDEAPPAPLLYMPKEQAPEPLPRQEVAPMPEPGTVGQRYDPLLVVVDGPTYKGLTDEGLGMAEEYARKGYPHSAFAARLGVSTTAWRAIRERHPQAAEAWSRGLALLDQKWTDKLHQHIDEGNLTALLFAFKAKLAYRDVGPTNPDAATGPTVNIQIVAPGDPATVAKLVGTAPPLPEEDQ